MLYIRSIWPKHRAGSPEWAALDLALMNLESSLSMEVALSLRLAFVVAAELLLEDAELNEAGKVSHGVLLLTAFLEGPDATATSLFEVAGCARVGMGAPLTLSPTAVAFFATTGGAQTGLTALLRCSADKWDAADFSPVGNCWLLLVADFAFFALLSSVIAVSLLDACEQIIGV